MSANHTSQQTLQSSIKKKKFCYNLKEEIDQMRLSNLPEINNDLEFLDSELSLWTQDHRLPLLRHSVYTITVFLFICCSVSPPM